MSSTAKPLTGRQHSRYATKLRSVGYFYVECPLLQFGYFCFGVIAATRDVRSLMGRRTEARAGIEIS
jgi:hypothetical protein